MKIFEQLGGCFSSVQYAYTEEYEHQRGKGSFPAHLTPGYKISKKASEQASDVSRHSSKLCRLDFSPC